MQAVRRHQARCRQATHLLQANGIAGAKDDDWRAAYLTLLPCPHSGLSEVAFGLKEQTQLVRISCAITFGSNADQLA